MVPCKSNMKSFKDWSKPCFAHSMCMVYAVVSLEVIIDRLSTSRSISQELRACDKTCFYLMLTMVEHI